MKKFFLIFVLFLFSTTNIFAEYKLEPVNCTLKKKDNCGAYLYNTKTGSTYFCNSNECKEILEAIEVIDGEESSASKKSKIPKKKKSKIPKFKKKTN